MAVISLIQHYLQYVQPYFQQLASISYSVVKFPVNYLILLPLSILYQIINHLIIIPTLIAIRITIYAIVYLPLKPVLFILGIELEAGLSVDESLYNLIIKSWPHLVFASLQITNYFIVCLIFGGIVGIFSGISLSLVSYLLTSLETKTIDFIQGSETAISVKKEPHTPYLDKYIDRIFENDSISTSIKRDPLSILKHRDRRGDNGYLMPLIKQEYQPLAQTDNDSRANIYEDDDGYSYSIYDLKVKKESRGLEGYFPLVNNDSKSDDTDDFSDDVFTNRQSTDSNTINTDATIHEDQEEEDKGSR